MVNMSSIRKRLGLKKARQYLEMNGYKTKQSIIIFGKSGKKYKIDLLALKTDKITKIRIVISFKQWKKPIGKDSVNKIKKLMDDIDANKGIIISLSSTFGFSAEAKKTAANTGIELWSNKDLEKRLIGDESLSQPHSIETARPRKTALSLSPKIRKKDAIAYFLNSKSEELISTDLVYLSCYLVQFTHSTKEGLIQKKQNVKVLWDLYEGIEGEHYQIIDSNLRFVDFHSGGLWISPVIIYPRLNSDEIMREIKKSGSKLRNNENLFESQKRWKTINKLFGRYREESTIRSIKEVYYPLFVSLLKGNNGERWAIMDGYSGNPSKQLNAIFNRNSPYIRRFMLSKR
jgi:uncharacterized protein Veg